MVCLWKFQKYPVSAFFHGPKQSTFYGTVVATMAFKDIRLIGLQELSHLISCHAQYHAPYEFVCICMYVCICLKLMMPHSIITLFLIMSDPSSGKIMMAIEVSSSYYLYSRNVCGITYFINVYQFIVFKDLNSFFKRVKFICVCNKHH